MSRQPRHKSKKATFYHLFTRVAGDPAYFPLRRPLAAQKFIALFEFYSDLYCCHLAAFQLMGNHYHAVVHFKEFRVMGRKELHQKAARRFGRNWEQKTKGWADKEWAGFNRGLFDVSRFMQHVNGEFAKWFNRRYRRRGHFWADRFKNPELKSVEAIQAALLYVELNAVRAGLVSLPEEHPHGSAHWRWVGQKRPHLIPLQELFPSSGGNSFDLYRTRLFVEGGVGVEDEQKTALGEEDGSLEFGVPGSLRQRLRFITDGVAIGSASQVESLLEDYRKRGLYKRRRNPIPQLGGRLFSLREQRSHAFAPG